MAGVGPTDLHELATDLLAACVEALDTIPVYDATLNGAPDRSFVSPGLPALDCCDQLTIHVGNISVSTSAPGNPKAAKHWINWVQLTILAARCVPVQDENGNPPAISLQQAAAEQLNADKWALWNHLNNLVADGDLFDQCCDVIFGNLSPLGQLGGCGGSSLNITVCLEGYEEVFGT